MRTYVLACVFGGRGTVQISTAPDSVLYLSPCRWSKHELQGHRVHSAFPLLETASAAAVDVGLQYV